MRAFTLAVAGFVFVIAACTAGETTVEVQRSPVAAVSVTLPAPSLISGQKERATATPVDANGAPLSGRPIVWQTSSAAIAVVNDSGMVSAVSPGSAVIMAVSEGVTGQATMSVLAPSQAPVGSVSVGLAASSIVPGQTTQATATTFDADGNILVSRAIAWISTNTGVATVSASGLVTGVASGTAQIRATSEGQVGSATLTVAAPPPVPVAFVSVALAASSRNPGETTQASATTRDANNNVLTGRTITWSSSNTGVATVSNSGLVTAIAVGTVQIIAACEGQTGNATFSVTSAAPPPVASVTVALGAGSLNPGSTTQATATTFDAGNNVLTGRAITWSTSNSAFATVSTSGLVTAVGVGSVQVIATSEGQTGSATLNVRTAGSSNEPAGMTVISDRPFNAINELGWADDNWGNPTGGVIIQDATAPKSPTSVLRTTLPSGFKGGGGTFSGDFTLATPRTLYVSYWARMSSNWIGGGIHKQFYAYTDTPASIYLDAYGEGTGTIQPQIAGQNIVAGGNGYGDPQNPDWPPNLVPSAHLVRGQWYHIEVVLVGNIAGNADGSIDWYLDGVHVGSYSKIQFATNAAHWNQLHYTNLWNGTTVPATQTLDFDHLYTSGHQ
jgi:uncharacterized protein YjdB